MPQLCGPAQAAGADRGGRPHILQVQSLACDQNIDRRFPFRNGTDTQARRYVRRHILHAVHGDIDAPSKSASSISLTKRPLPPTLASGTSRILSPLVLMISSATRVPGWRGFEAIFDPVGLPQGQLAAACSNGDRAAHQCPQPAQLEALQPPQEEVAAVDFTVSPPLPLLKKPQATSGGRLFCYGNPSIPDRVFRSPGIRSSYHNPDIDIHKSAYRFLLVRGVAETPQTVEGTRGPFRLFAPSALFFTWLYPFWQDTGHGVCPGSFVELMTRSRPGGNRVWSTNWQRMWPMMIWVS
jgi:hypothetical protein